MKTIGLIASVVGASLVTASAASAQPLWYWGKSVGSRGLIELDSERYYEVEVGTEIPAWGRVKEILDDRVVVEQIRTNAEKDVLRRQGHLVYDEMEIHILREGLRRPGS